MKDAAAVILLLLVIALFLITPAAVGYYRELQALRVAVEEVGAELKAIRVLVPGSP